MNIKNRSVMSKFRPIIAYEHKTVCDFGVFLVGLFLGFACPAESERIS
jgi:hypothetical protein